MARATVNVLAYFKIQTLFTGVQKWSLFFLNFLGYILLIYLGEMTESGKSKVKVLVYQWEKYLSELSTKYSVHSNRTISKSSALLQKQYLQIPLLLAML